jgi:hypothetical protein
MAHVRISIPKDVVIVNRPGFRGRRFTTDEQRAREEKEERNIKYAIRYFQRHNFAENTHLDIEIKKVESIVKLRDSLLQELAMRENVSKGLSPDTGAGICERPEETLDKKKNETVEVLKTLV